MYDVDTLFIISSSRGAYVLDDLISAIQAFNPSGSHFIVAVDETGKIESLGDNAPVQILHATEPVQDPAFKRAQGLLWAIEAGIAYKQVIMMSDTCLIRGGAIGEYWMGHIQQEGVGLVGVATTKSYRSSWKTLAGQLYELGLENDQWDKPPIAMSGDFLILSPTLATVMYQRKLLLPPLAADWSAGFGTYMAWVAQLLNFYAIGWGFTHKQLPPLYISEPGHETVAPHLLMDRFMVVSSVLAVPGYGENDLRELFKRQRGEPAADVAKFSPVVYGPEQQGETD